jgi:hypothetical protein
MLNSFQCQVCSTTPGLFVFTLGFQIIFDVLGQFEGSDEVDRIEQSLKLMFRWVERGFPGTTFLICTCGSIYAIPFLLFYAFVLKQEDAPLFFVLVLIRDVSDGVFVLYAVLHLMPILPYWTGRNIRLQFYRLGANFACLSNCPPRISLTASSKFLLWNIGKELESYWLILGRIGPISGLKSALPKLLKYTIELHAYFVLHAYFTVLNVPNDRITHPWFWCRCLPSNVSEWTTSRQVVTQLLKTQVNCVGPQADLEG